MKSIFKRSEIKFRNEIETHPVRIVADGAIATVGIGEGRLIPIIILDTINRPDIEEFTRVHQSLSPGDVSVQWGDLDESDGRINLILKFERPAELGIILEFDVRGEGILVEQILDTKGLYIQPGKPGDTISSTMENMRILLEIPDTGFKKNWDDIFFKAVVKDLRNKGLNRHDAKIAAKKFADEWRKIGRLRIPRRG